MYIHIYIYIYIYTYVFDRDQGDTAILYYTILCYTILYYTIHDSRTLSDECRCPREHLGSEQKPRAGNADTILKISSKEKT